MWGKLVMRATLMGNISLFLGRKHVMVLEANWMKLVIGSHSSSWLCIRPHRLFDFFSILVECNNELTAVACSILWTWINHSIQDKIKVGASIHFNPVTHYLHWIPTTPKRSSFSFPPVKATLAYLEFHSVTQVLRTVYLLIYYFLLPRWGWLSKWMQLARCRDYAAS
jgi:hypothetical protein